jgi:hypothetical protein
MIFNLTCKYIEKQCKEAANEAILFEFTSKTMQQKNDLPRLAIIRPKSSKTPFFISSGFGIDFETAANFAFACVGKNGTTLNPIRMVYLEYFPQIHSGPILRMISVPGK